VIKTKQIEAPVRQKPGPKPSGNAKVMVPLRIDQDTLAKFKSTGPGWQTKMTDALKRSARRL
jgi:uncharacterized protein (DUF4415 family)